MPAPDAHAPERATRRLLAGAVLLVAAALSLAGFAADAADRARVPTPEALAAAVDVVRAGYAEGDAVAVQPTWVEDLWRPLVERREGSSDLPVAALLTGWRYDAMELLRRRRLWVIGAFGAPPTLGVPWLDLPEPVERHDLGAGVVVALYELPELDHRGSLTEGVSRLIVARQPQGGSPKRCKLRGRIHHCGGPGWQDVGVERAHVYHRDVRWLHVVPGPGTTTLLVDWRAPAGEHLVVRAGFSLAAIRRDTGSEVRLSVRSGDDILYDVLIDPHRFVEVRHILPLPPPVKGRRQPLRFEIRATDHDHRHLYLEADVLGEVPEAVQRWAEASR